MYQHKAATFKCYFSDNMVGYIWGQTKGTAGLRELGTLATSGIRPHFPQFPILTNRSKPSTNLSLYISGMV